MCRELFANLHAHAVRTADAVAAGGDGDKSASVSCAEGSQRSQLQLGSEREGQPAAADEAAPLPVSAADEPTVDWAIVLELARRQSVSAAPAELQKRLASVSRSQGRPAQVTRDSFVHALAILFDGVAEKALADILAPYVAGDAVADPAGHLQPLYQRHVKGAAAVRAGAVAARKASCRRSSHARR